MNRQGLNADDRQIAKLLFRINLPASVLAIFLLGVFIPRYFSKQTEFGAGGSDLYAIIGFGTGVLCQVGFYKLKSKYGKVNRRLWWFYALLVQLGFIGLYVFNTVKERNLMILFLAIYPCWFLVHVYCGVKAHIKEARLAKGNLPEKI